MPGNTSSGFQQFVNRELPVGVPGDWAGANIRANVPVGPWALVAPPSGTTVGVICWADPTNEIASSYFRPNSFAGFVHREQQALITTFLGIATQQIPSGFGVTAQAQGDFWGIFTGGCSVGQKVYANPTTGALTGAASGGSVTASNTSVTITDLGAMTLVGTTTGTVAIGQIVVQAGQAPGLYIVSGSGTSWTVANLDGSPVVAVATTAASFYGVQETQFVCAQNVAAAASFTATLAASAGPGPFGVLTVSAVASGTLSPGQWVQSSGAVPVPLSANIQIIEQLTGTAGSTGTYLVSNTIAVGSGETFTTYNGQMAKIGTWANWT